MNREWTEEELEILRRDRAAKIPVPVIAAKLNRPVPATYQRARLIGTLVQKHQAWDEKSVACLRAMINADPPMTDKRMAEELGRTVSQIRWKMQDLGLIGVRDLSKLARIAATGSARQDVVPRPIPIVRKIPSIPIAPPSGQRTPALPQPSPKLRLERELSRLAGDLEVKLKNAIAESEAGMMRAAMAAIAEKKAMDQRLASLSPGGPEAKVDVKPEAAHSAAERQKRPQAAASKPVETQAQDVKSLGGKRAAKDTGASEAGRKVASTRPSTLPKKPAVSAIPAMPRPASLPSARPPTPLPPKIVVLDTPAPAQDTVPLPQPEQSQTSGRGGWKAVRRDPARVVAQARAKATNRADAVDLAQAAQTAIEKFIAQRGVTRSEAGGTQTLVTRLQARGYIVVGQGEGWIIDQRHRVAGVKELEAFAAARGITQDAAA
jgi:hypothetical protein